IPKLKLQKPVESETLFSTLNLKGIPSPRNPQRPPQQFEADGRRYSLKNRQVKYLDWTFNFRMSPFTGPSVYDIRFKGERIAYEIGLSEISLYYSGFAPMQQMYSYPDSAVLLGTHSKSLIPGADCPEFSTLINQTFWGQLTDEPSSYDSSFCLFEQNAGIPLRRHSSYEKSQGSFYGGMLDSVLTLRSILSVFSNDYIIDFTFHQNGIIQGQLTNTGYLLPSYFNRQETLYGYRINKNIVGNIHQIFAHFRVDLDIGGTCNRYETLNIVKDQIPLQQDPDVIKYQTKIIRDLKTTEKRAVFDYNFRKPKYHLVYNNNVRNDLGQEKSYRIYLEGIAHSLLPEDIGGERSIPWARHQMVVTKFKDSERFSSSSYAYVDNLNPVVNFTKYYVDNESIVDQDLVFWITLGTHRIPHTEDIPLASTVGRELRFFLMPNNYFPECPSMNSRDALLIKHIDPKDKARGVEVNRNGNSREQCVTPKITLEDVLFRNPDLALESRRVNFVF
ncbi:amine oxidase [copper-containing], partial [Biomphalaria pfeifferi]